MDPEDPMTVSSDEERVVRRLVDFAGDPIIVEDALAALREGQSAPPTLGELLRKILELRAERGLGRPVERVAAG